MSDSQPTSNRTPFRVELGDSSGVISYTLDVSIEDVLNELVAEAPMEVWNSIRPGGVAFPDDFTPTQMSVELRMTHDRPVLNVHQVTILEDTPDNRGYVFDHRMPVPADFREFVDRHHPGLREELFPEDDGLDQLWQAPLWVRHVTAQVAHRATGLLANPHLHAVGPKFVL